MSVKVSKEMQQNGSALSQKEIQEKVVVYQILQNHIEQLKKQAELVEKAEQEADITLQVLDDLKKVKNDNEVLIPLGSGVFTKGKLTKSYKVLTNKGAGVFTDSTIDSVLKRVEDRKKEMSEAMQKIHEEVQKAVNQMAAIEQEMQKSQQD